MIGDETGWEVVDLYEGVGGRTGGVYYVIVNGPFLLALLSFVL